jgi:hypothetical protein
VVTRIRTRLKNGTEQTFPDYVLDHVIKKKQISAFERSDGWVEIGRDPVRREPSSRQYQGARKRRTDL